MKKKQNRALILTVLAIALPVAGQRLIDIAVNLADTMMLGSYGDSAISASSLANQFYSIFSIFCMGVSGGACVLANQYWGAGDKAAYKKVMNLMLRICMGGALLFMAVTALFPRQIMGLYSTDESVIEQGVQYLRVIVWVFFFHGVTTCLSNILRSANMAWLPLLVSCVSLFSNVFFNWVFIFGNLGAPEMRIQGAALGTLIARVIEFSIVAVYLLCKDRNIRFRLADLRMHVGRGLALSYWKSGFPVLIGDVFLAVGNNLVAMVIGNLGVEMAAANSICSMVVQLTTVVNMGLAMAGSVTVGQSIGMGKPDMARRLGMVFFGMSIVLGAAAGGLLIILTPWLMNYYNVSATTLTYANQLMYSFAILMPFQTVGSVLAKGVLRGGGDTRFLMIADVIFLWCASVPLGYLAGFVWGLSPFWIQFLLRIDSVIKSVWCAARLFGGKWIRSIAKAQP
jgi:putative MATE family efflux protein